VLLYGAAPGSEEPTLELLRRPLPVDDDPARVAAQLLDRTLTAWGWSASLGAASRCVAAVIEALDGHDPETLELFAFRRAHQLTVEVHHTGADVPFHEVVAGDRRLTAVESLAPLWGVRPIVDGDAVWFEFRST